MAANTRRPEMCHWLICWCAAGLVCAGLTACNGTTSTVSSGGSSGRTELAGSAVEHPGLENIPIPAGFQLVDDRSFSSQSGQLRHANYEFRGDTPPARVSRFYEEYMPSAGFTLRQKRFDRGEYVLDFDSSSECSTVRIKRDKFRTVLTVNVSPRPKGAIERDTTGPANRP